MRIWNCGIPSCGSREAGYAVKCAAPQIKTYAGKHGYPAASDLLLRDARSEDFCGLLVPGGFMPDKLRRDAKVLSLTREFYESGKLVAFICHGGWIPVSAKILRGKRVTGSLGIKDDLENAGGIWVDEPVVVDGNLISSRTPRDLAPFGEAMVEFLREIIPSLAPPRSRQEWWSCRSRVFLVHFAMTWAISCSIYYDEHE